MGESVSLARLLTDIEERDARDQSRIVSPLVPAEDAIVIDSTALSADEVLQAARDLAVARDLQSDASESRLDPAEASRP
jgi:cytidylate kinase